MIGIKCLIALHVQLFTLIFRGAFYVRGQRHFTEAFGQLGDTLALPGLELYQVFARAIIFYYRSLELVRLVENGSGSELTSGFEQTPPLPGAPGGAKQQALDGAPSGPYGSKPGLEDCGIVAKYPAARRQQIRQFLKIMVGYTDLLTFDNQEPRGVPTFRGNLRDTGKRQFVIKQSGIHRRQKIRLNPANL